MSYLNNYKFPWSNLHGLNLDWVIQAVTEIKEYDANLDERFDAKEDKDNLTNVRKLSESGDFTGTWNGETLQQVKNELQALVDALQADIDALELEDIRIEDKFDTEVARIDVDLVDLESTKEDSINISSNRLLSPTGDFTGTWETESYTDFKQQITNAETLYAEVIALIAGNPNLAITVVDGGFYGDGTTPIVNDLGGFDPVTVERDAGNLLNPCSCSV